VEDFFTAAGESHLSNGRPERNALDERLFTNAGKVVAANLPRGVLYYPNVENVLDEVVIRGSSGGTGIVAFLFVAGSAVAWYMTRKG